MTEIVSGRADRDALRTAWHQAGLSPDQSVGGAIDAGCAAHAAGKVRKRDLRSLL